MTLLLLLALWGLGGLTIGIIATAAVLGRHIEEERQTLLNRLGILHRQTMRCAGQALEEDNGEARAHHLAYAKALNDIALEIKGD